MSSPTYKERVTREGKPTVAHLRALGGSKAMRIVPANLYSPPKKAPSRRDLRRGKG